MLSSAYRLLTNLGGPVIQLFLRRRLGQGREDAARFPERLGVASQPRPMGRLIWCHAASVGEAASLLALIDKLRTTYPDMQILVTTGTVTSARMMEGRLPPGALHQYVPVDRLPYIKRFLDHWHPDFVLWIESELWPNTLAEMRRRLIPAALLNARMSEKSFRKWYRVRGWAKEILSTFVLCLTQTEEEHSRFVALGARPARCVGNLKYAGNPLPFKEEALAELRQSIGTRVCWLMASTHGGEEKMALDAHEKLRAQWPQLLTIIVPRHAIRGSVIAEQITARKLPFVRRSKNGVIGPETQVYLADTMGELGLFLRLSPIVVMGGSFVASGGHNLIEPAQLGAAILFGPHMYNFAEMAREFTARNAALALKNASDIAFAVNRFLTEPETRERMATAARELANEKRHVLDKVLEALEPWLRQRPDAVERRLDEKVSA